MNPCQAAKWPLSLVATFQIHWRRARCQVGTSPRSLRSKHSYTKCFSAFTLRVNWGESKNSSKQGVLERMFFFFAPAPIYAPLVGGKALCTQAIGHVAAQFCYGVPELPSRRGNVTWSRRIATHVLCRVRNHMALWMRRDRKVASLKVLTYYDVFDIFLPW